jgi:seryl-tRNA synthetase
MHDIKWIREHPSEFDDSLRARGLEPMAAVILNIDEKRRETISALERTLARRKSAAEEVAKAKRQGNEGLAKALIEEASHFREQVSFVQNQRTQLEKELWDTLAQIANVLLPDVPPGLDSSSNVEHHRFGRREEFTFPPKQHFELGKKLGLMDFRTAGKLSGARFVVLKGALARLERALQQLMLNVHVEQHGYTEINPPLIVRNESMFGTAQLPKFAEDQFMVEKLSRNRFILESYIKRYPEHEQKWHELQRSLLAGEKEISESLVEGLRNDIPDEEFNELYDEVMQPRLWLIPTAEVPLTNLVREEILAEAQLPLRFTAGTPCFRAEAGAAGKDTRGMIRQHQFDKVELVSITTPEQSRDEHERMLACAEEILRRLDLHYRVVVLCTGDTGFASQKTYDIEVWLPGQGAYREISSCSICGEFQARRMNARYRGKDGRVHHVHTLNGSGVAVGRALIAVMETYQQEDGSIAIPEALRPYMGGIERIERPA